ncbi:PPOX class F420-dependent oxidoreductase [Millisia brevis]|uniref:PPOX class F420-dependent oxidoreductase n=1 Tax=Millisia brevis TaxID=264148 RepID=UPI000835CC58|nr:PPOX class F420-dependent oxidoreductase [Millisia brevis]
MTFDPRALLADSSFGILATIKANGMPQLSPVTPWFDRENETILISTREGLVKTSNLRRDPRAALEVSSSDGRDWATAEGSVTLIGPSDDPNGPEVEALVDYYRGAAGEHPDWDEYRSVMVSDRRVLIRITVEHIYGATIRRPS